MEKPDVLLCSTLHDPKGVFLDNIASVSHEVSKNYRVWVINVTTNTDKKIKERLKGLSNKGIIMTETDPGNMIVPNKIENDHLSLLKQAYRIALELGIKKIQYTDGDRIITAAEHFSKEFHQMARDASELTSFEKSYINFRRSQEDILTHHIPLVVTEAVFNRHYSDVFGLRIDIGSSGHSMSLDVLDKIISRSPAMESVSFPHPKWILIAKEMGATIQAVDTEKVLSFETPEQYKNETLERKSNFPGTSYPNLQKRYLDTLGRDSTYSAKEWNLRYKTLEEYLNVLKNHLNVFNLSSEKEDKIRKAIDNSLVSMTEGHQYSSEKLG